MYRAFGFENAAFVDLNIAVIVIAAVSAAEQEIFQNLQFFGGNALLTRRDQIVHVNDAVAEFVHRYTR